MTIQSLCRFAALCAAVSAPAFAQTSSVLDTAGDAFLPGAAHSVAPGWLDIVAADFTIEADGSWTFQVTVAEPVPAALPNPPGQDADFVWAFPMDLDPLNLVCGAPFPNDHFCTPPERGVAITWDGTSFTGALNSRIDDLTAPLSVTVNGDTLSISLPASLASQLSPLPGARWRALALLAHTAVPSDGILFADATPWTA